jgi:hypothetical protein
MGVVLCLSVVQSHRRPFFALCFLVSQPPSPPPLPPLPPPPIATLTLSHNTLSSTICESIQFCRLLSLSLFQSALLPSDSLLALTLIATAHSHTLLFFISYEPKKHSSHTQTHMVQLTVTHSPHSHSLTHTTHNTVLLSFTFLSLVYNC